MKLRTLCLAIAFLSVTSPTTAQSRTTKDTETVVVNFQVKDGKEGELTRVLSKAWTTYRRLNMVLPKLHLLAHGKDVGGKTFFVEVFTWRDHDQPDNAPAEVKKLWAEMEALCEPRAGREGIEFNEVHFLP
jgi:hypothetical protein